MKPLFFLSSLFLLLSANATADEEPQTPSAEQILTMARSVFANEHYFFEGELQPNQRRDDIAIVMSVMGSDMEIVVDELDSVFLYIRLGESGGTLEFAQPSREIERRAMNHEELSASVRRTDLTYEDIGMRFLYWDENAIVLEDARISARDCWTVRAENPNQEGPYSWVDVRVDKETGALMQVLGYDSQGRLSKRFMVDDVQLHRGQYYLRSMRIESIDNKGTREYDDDEVSGRTYLRLEEPQRANNGF